MSTISIKPAQKAEIVGAKIGDRVSWIGLADLETYFGTIAGIDADRLELDVESEYAAGGRPIKRYIAPSRVTLAPKTFAIGDKVLGKDHDKLPDCTVLSARGWLPVAKTSQGWSVIDHDRIREGSRPVAHVEYTIVHLPSGYLERTA